MQRLTLANLSNATLDEVVIRAISATLYQVEIHLTGAEERSLLCHPDNSPITFPHLEAIRECLLDTPASQYYLLHESPFDEMIGLNSGATTLKTRLAWSY